MKEEVTINSSIRLKKIKEQIMYGVFIIATIVFILAVLIIFLFVINQAWPAFAKIGFFKFIFGLNWSPTGTNASFGIFPMIVGTIYVTVGALLLSVPIGLLTAIFIAYYCPLKVYKPLKLIVNILTGIPSVIFGFFGLEVISPIIGELGGSPLCWLTASIILSVMVLPTIINLSENALKALPKTYFEGSVALGATKERTIIFTQIPAAKSGIMGGIILALARVVGETVAVSLIAGNSPIIPNSILQGITTLSSAIVNELDYASGMHLNALYGMAAVLFVLIFLITLTLLILRNLSEKKARKYKKRVKQKEKV